MFARSLFQPYRMYLLQPWYFLEWWYAEVLKNLVLFCFYLVARVEDTFSFLVMLKQLVTLQPLHQDYSVVGRGIGVTIRLFWIVFGLIALVLSLAIAILIMSVWILLPLLPLVGMIVCIGAAL
jgi:hypothetical protein